MIGLTSSIAAKIKDKIKNLGALSIAALLIASAIPASAVTRAEMLSSLWSALDYETPPEMKLPPDVPISHKDAKHIGWAGRWGLIPIDEPFAPDEEINRHDAVRLSLMMMGWGFELKLTDEMAALPDFGGSGDSVFFLAAEMKPSPPETILIDGATPLSETARTSLSNWAARCKQEGVRWNRVYSYAGTELALFRQGVAMPGVKNEPGAGSPIGAKACEPMFVSAISVHPQAADTRIAFAEPFGRPRVSPTSFADSFDAIAAINGGFFDGGRPLGSMLLNGVPAGRPIEGRGAIGWNSRDGVIVFGRGDARIGVRAGSRWTEVVKFNTAPPADDAALFTSDITRSLVGVPPDALRIVSQNGIVTEVRLGNDGDIWLPEGSVALIARGRSRAAVEGVQVGDIFQPTAEWTTQSFSSCTDLIQGGPMLLWGGAPLTDREGIKPDVSERRHPRTIVGTDGTRVTWAVIDGRSSIHSRGATIDETAWIAKSLGLTTALNLDGGGSSQLVWRGVLTNSPSDGKQRPIPYAVLVVPRGTQLAWRPPSNSDEWGDWLAPAQAADTAPVAIPGWPIPGYPAAAQQAPVPQAPRPDAPAQPKPTGSDVWTPPTDDGSDPAVDAYLLQLMESYNK